MGYNRILLKLSGEALAGDRKFGFDEQTCLMVGHQVATLISSGIEVAIVIGGGNFWRGKPSKGLDRVKADQIGMLAMLMNCIYTSEIFRSIGLSTQVFSAFPCGEFAYTFEKDKVSEALKLGKVVFLAGGTGHPYFSTDTGTTLRAVELEADIILMARAIDGVYDSDPKKNPNATKFSTISIDEVISRKLGVVDMTAAVMCMENKMPLLVFSLYEANSIVQNATGECTGTIVTVD
jgi:uridylate kinase